MATDNKQPNIKASKPTGAKKRRKRSRSTVHAPKNQAIKYPLLCFDTETTNHGELLEISVFDIEGNEVYHRYFRPHATGWPTDIHHITPEMVAGAKRFAAHRHELQKLLSSARYLVGCALSNDLSSLRRHGLELPLKTQSIIEIQNWYWLLNDPSGRTVKQQTGLAAIAEAYNLGFGQDQPHSATADTRLTLDCFRHMATHLLTDKGMPTLPQAPTTDHITGCVSLFNAEYSAAMQLLRMHSMAGYVSVVKRDIGYSFKFNRVLAAESPNIILSVPVTDRVQADKDLHKHFSHKELKGYTGIYEFDAEDLEYIRNYRNELSLEKFMEREQDAQTASANKAKHSRQAKRVMRRLRSTSKKGQTLTKPASPTVSPLTPIPNKAKS